MPACTKWLLIYMTKTTSPMRKRSFTFNPAAAGPLPGELDLVDLAIVAITSESADNPIENAFDQRRGPGGSRWVAHTPGEQTLILTFDAPQALRRVSLEVEEVHESRTQELQLAVSHDGGNTFRELLRQEFTFSPSGATFEHEEWTIVAEKVTHLRLCLNPDKGGRPCRASLTCLSIQ